MATTSTDARRRRWLIGAAGIALTGASPLTGLAQGGAAHIEIWSADGCECCSQWTGHLQQHRFDIVQRKVDDVAAMRRQLGMPEKYAGCHVARTGRFAIDGHVPALDIVRLLRQQPQAIGLAVPGMRVGAPGIERTGRSDPYQVLLIGLDANATFFTSYF